MTRESHLVEVARRAERWFTNKLEGNGRNGPNDDLLLARSLMDALAPYAEDMPDPRKANLVPRAD